MRAIVGLLLILFTSHIEAITKQEMIDNILNVGEEVTQEGNSVSFDYHGVGVILVFDETADRMRLISPIAPLSKVDNGILLNAMEANYHSVLDARYAVSNDIVWSAFMHPINDLSVDLFLSAIRQVAIANATFGSEFTGGELIFPGNTP